MNNRRSWKCAFRVLITAFLGAASTALAADSVLVVDRGLPRANLNNVSGTARSNVRWGWHDQGFLGDDFTIGAAGERWVIDSIRTWSVPGKDDAGATLGDFYQDVRLYFGGPNVDLTPVATAQLSPGSDETGNPSVRVSEATAGGALMYDDFGDSLRIYQVEFGNLNLAVEGGVRYRFGVWGLGRAIPRTDGKTYQWFNHASNGALSGIPQDGADGRMLLFTGSGRAAGEFSAEGNGWDKPADINVQVFAHRADRRARPTPPSVKQ